MVFQSLARSFGQLFCARLTIGINRANVEALYTSRISDLMEYRNVFIGESVLYVGFYISEAISGQVATAFTFTGQNWRIALRFMGIVGSVVLLPPRLLQREPERGQSLVKLHASR